MGEPYSGLVLVVDGDTALRRAMRDYLMQSGCAVLEARDAYDALFIIAQYGKSISLLITEINLLPVGGIKLAENALRLVPSLQVICTSADVEMRGVKYWMRYLRADFLPKPFALFQLHEKVIALLGHRHQDAPIPTRAPLATRWESFRPHADMSKPASNNDDPLFWLKEF
jgi:DNA-binding NtrC family response regulator